VIAQVVLTGELDISTFDHEVRFYTVEHHTSAEPDDVKRFDDPAELGRARQKVERTTTTTTG
jgi:hypothetical protein